MAKTLGGPFKPRSLLVEHGKGGPGSVADGLAFVILLGGMPARLNHKRVVVGRRDYIKWQQCW